MAQTTTNEEASKDAMEGRPAEEFPTHALPVTYADGILSISYTRSSTKFYLFRIDPNMFGRGGNVLNPVGQVVMPMDGFIQASAFFQQQIDLLIAKGVISEQQVDEVRAAFPSPEKLETGDAN